MGQNKGEILTQVWQKKKDIQNFSNHYSAIWNFTFPNISSTFSPKQIISFILSLKREALRVYRFH